VTRIEDTHCYASELVTAWLELTRLQNLIAIQADEIAKLKLELAAERRAK
jgi:hypothetical protein